MDKVNTILPWKIRINHYSPIFSKILHLWFLLKYLKLDSRSWSDLYCFWHICIIWLVHWYTFKKLQSRTKMSRRMAVAMSSFKKNFLEYWQKKITHKVELWLDHFSPWLNNIDHQTWCGGGRIHGGNKSAKWVSCGWVKLFFQGCKWSISGIQ